MTQMELHISTANWPLGVTLDTNSPAESHEAKRDGRMGEVNILDKDSTRVSF